MKILHLADLHIGTESYGRIDADTGLPTRMLDVLKALDEAVEFAISAPVDLILFGGDAYQKRDPSQTQQREFARRLKRLSEAGVPAFLLVGNHDLPGAAGRAHSVEIFPTLGVNNIFVGNRPQVTVIATRGGPVQVAALPWFRRGGMLARETARSQTLEEINEALQQRLTETIAELARGLDPKLPAILAAHIYVHGARVGSEGSMVMGKEPALLPANVALPDFDYVALGHIHRAQCVFERPPACYPGSLTRLDFGDEDQDKGFYVIELDPARERGARLVAPPEFHRLDTRRFVTIVADVADDDPDPTATILKAIGRRQSDVKDAIVKLQLALPQGRESLLREADIARALKEAHHTTIAKQVSREARSRLGAWTEEQLSPMQALNIYLETRKVAESRRQQLLRYAESLVPPPGGTGSAS